LSRLTKLVEYQKTKAQLLLGGADCSCLHLKASKRERSCLLTYTRCDIT